ncbi:MAG: ATP-binding cassette domain-containing protein [Bacteroidota bacterium]
MIEPILKALIQLFALISDVHDIRKISGREKDIVRLFLSRQLNNELVKRYMTMFDENLVLYNSENIARGSIRDKKRTSLNSVRILGICEKINAELDQKQKMYVLVQLMDFILFGAEITENELDFLETVSTAFNVPQAEYGNIKNFILNSVNDVPEKNRVMIIDNKDDCEPEGVKHLFKENLRERIFLLYLESTNKYILRYSGKDDLFLNGQNIFPDQTYTFDHGSTIRGSGIDTIYYNDITSVFTDETFKLKISIDATDVCLKFKNSEYGIQRFNFYEESGNLVGILGGSGVGKTTILNVLSGITKPQSGEVLINGFNLYSEKEKTHLKGVIGFVPQDDLLIEELTVYQNLYYNAKMCLDNLSEVDLEAVVNKALIELDLDEIRNLKVGNSLNKVISGGQRKRLNIALELIREPTILFVDEPTSGLSSVDSEIVMNLLKEQTYRGKLVIINIHQPGSDLYKMFDKIMIIDKGGYQIFYGNPSQAIVYFKTKAGYANADEDQCITCGNINSDQLLQIIEAKVVNENGKHTHIRKVTPREWAEKFDGIAEKTKQKTFRENRLLPENFYSIPGLIKQAKIFFIRDILSKLANRQNILIMLLIAPLLAFILAYFTKYSTNGKYLFSENENLPAYLFMSVITSLFLGLIISAEEIVKDRKILKRESFLNLSWFSYLNSKVMIMFLISAIQTITFILIGNFILEIKGMTFSYWFVLFTTSCVANMLGLNISSAFNSVITIYSLIPCIIIPQLLFSGFSVKFDRLHQGSFTSSEFVPVIGDMMPLRWSFEALAVEQFTKNKFERNFFNYKMTASQNIWYADYLMYEMKKDIKRCQNAEIGSSELSNSFNRLKYYLNYLSGIAEIKIPDNLKPALNVESLDSAALHVSLNYLDLLTKKFRGISKNSSDLQDSVYKSIVKKIGEKEFMGLKDNYYNKSLEDLVLNRLNINKSVIIQNKIVQKYEPAYMKPLSKYGRAQFYAPYKQVGNLKIDTFWFNEIVLWVVTLFLYTALYFNVLQKIVTYSENLRFAKSDRQSG